MKKSVEENIPFEEELRSRLAAHKFLKLDSLRPHCLLSVDSTQDYLLQNGTSREGDFVLSVMQTEGRGREQRSWSSPEGGLWLSLILKPYPGNLDKIPMAAALSILQTLKDDYRLDNLSIKEPNDVICNGRKIAGVLVDAWIKENESTACLGIGVDVNNSIENDTPALAKIATSYFDQTKQKIPLLDFAFCFLVNFDKKYAELSGSRPNSLPQERNK